MSAAVMTMQGATRWLPTGTVYGTLLNFGREFGLWAPKMGEAPYKAAPQAPVLYVKTANTFAPSGAAIAVPGPVWVGPSLGLVIGDFNPKWALALDRKEQTAMNSVVGCVLLNDLSLPHQSYYRPGIRYRNRDGFLACGAEVKPLGEVDVGALKIEAHVNGQRVQTIDLSTLVRSARQLLSDVSAFMTLQPGDVLTLGTDCLADGSRPLAQAGDSVEIRADEFEPLTSTLVAEGVAAAPGRPRQRAVPSKGSADASARSVGA